ncbi:MAG: hypothetical protein Q4Q03_00205 [Bowdeniella nasicola]|nr:hypothetical protein [Bowdeniella nasicola]
MRFRIRPLHRGDAEDALAAFQSDPMMGRQGEVRDLTSAQRYVD